MESQTSVMVENLCKSYKSHGKKDSKIEVLHNISFEVKEGERVGIIGRNGAGKSTLLNILSHYAEADSGNVVIGGKVNAILDIGTNLRKELTGKENVKQAGVLYGYKEVDIERMLLEIEEFVDIGDYWDRPVRTYSSGMKARIAFAQIAFIQPEILIIDEVLGVGDYQFVDKSKRKMQELCSKGKILFLVSHALDTVRSMTNRCIWLEQGKIMMDDTTDHVIAAYEEFINDFERKQLWEAERKRIEIEKNRSAGKASYIESLYITDGVKAENLFQSGDDISVEVNIILDSMDEQYDLKLCLEDGKGNIILENFYSEDSGEMLETNERKALSISTVIENANFTENSYIISAKLIKNKNIIDSKERLFRIIDQKKEYYALPLAYMTSVWDVTFEEVHIKNEHIWSNSKSI